MGFLNYIAQHTSDLGNTDIFQVISLQNLYY